MPSPVLTQSPLHYISAFLCMRPHLPGSLLSVPACTEHSLLSASSLSDGGLACKDLEMFPFSLPRTPQTWADCVASLQTPHWCILEPGEQAPGLHMLCTACFPQQPMCAPGPPLWSLLTSLSLFNSLQVIGSIGNIYLKKLK